MAAPQIDWQAGDVPPAPWPGKVGAMTLVVRVRGLVDAGELLRWGGPDGTPSVARLAVEADGNLVFELGFSHNPSPLRLVAPVARIGADQAHVLVVRYLGHRLELWVDGVLMDEDWPVGSLLETNECRWLPRDGVTQFQGWSEVWADGEVPAISGGDENLRERRTRYLGVETPVGQYWRPQGLNVNVGDCMPFWDEAQQRFRVYYLLDRRNHGSMWGCGGHQWAQVSTADLRSWTQHPLALAIDAGTAGSICTGSVFSHVGTYHAFHAVRMADRSAAPLCVSTSSDGVHFTPALPLIRLAPPYDSQAARDPVVFHDRATGLFHLLATTALVDQTQPGASTGCLAWLVSSDLRHWVQREPFYVPGGADQPECPDYFLWNGWYYLIFSLQGVARYRRSRQPFGPWEQQTVDTLDDSRMRVMKTAAYRDNRRLGVVFVSDHGGYAGRMVVRELIQRADGTLGTQWPVEMPPPN